MTQEFAKGAYPAVPGVAERGHILSDVPGMTQGLHTRWDCQVCGCWVWVRRNQEPYGTALTGACSTLVGRGQVTCDRCGSGWRWPGTFEDEAAARAYTHEHVCGASNMRVEVFAGPDATGEVTP